MSKEIVFLVLITFQHCSSFSPNITFLSKVNRLNDTNFTDYYFSCNLVGRFLSWQYNNEALSGFQPNDLGEAVVSRESSFEYTTTLLSATNNETGTVMDSILVMSFENLDTSSFTFAIACSNEASISTIHTNKSVERDVRNRDEIEDDTLRLDYVLSSTVQSGMYTHVFMCGARSEFQYLEAIGPPIGFRRNGNLGEVKTVLSANREALNIQGVLMAQQPLSTITLFIIVTEISEVNVRCFYDNEHELTLPSYSSSSPAHTSRSTELASTTVLLSESPSATTEVETPIVDSNGMLYKCRLGTYY